MQNTLIPARAGKSLKLPLLWALCAFAGLVQAQGYTVPGSERARPRSLVDHSRTDALVGRPQYATDACPFGTVLSGDRCITLSSLSAGATVLPGNVPGGTYTNAAPYPLSLTLLPSGACYHGLVHVNGALVARATDACEWSFTSAQAIIPAGVSFSMDLSNMYAVVTAMSANAIWRDTGIRFPASFSAWVQVPGTDAGTRNVFDQNGVFMRVETNPTAFYVPPPVDDNCCGG